jgi:hypothetical protein
MIRIGRIPPPDRKPAKTSEKACYHWPKSMFAFRLVNANESKAIEGQLPI